MADDEAWDVVEDLPFLIAHDDELQDDLSQVCEILLDGDVMSNTSSASEHDEGDGLDAKVLRTTKRRRPRDDSSPSVHAPRQPGDSFSVRQKKEIVLLKHQVELLKRHLHDRQATKSNSEPVSTWETVAKQQCWEKHVVLVENKQLREAVREQATFIDHMASLCRKKPRLTQGDMQSEAWQTYRLAAHESLRIAAIHAIADRQLRRMAPAFIAAKVFDATEDVHRLHLVQRADSTYMLEVIVHVVLPAPFDVVGNAAWAVFSGNAMPMYDDGTAEALETIDSNTVYSHLVQLCNGPGTTTPMIHKNMIRKRYCDPDRVVLVARSVLEDARSPHVSRGSVEDKWSWLRVLPHESAATAGSSSPWRDEACDVTYAMQTVLDPLSTTAILSQDAIGPLVAGLAHLSSSIFLPRPGMFPSLNIDQSAIPVPSLRGYFDRGIRFMNAMEQAINDATLRYQTHHDRRS